MTIKRATTRAVDDAVYLLLDERALRLCACWNLVPASIRNSGLHDLASYMSRYADCTVNEAMTRVEMMLRAGILKPTGQIDEKVAARLRRAGALRMGLEDEEPQDAKGGETEEDEDDD